VFFGKVKVSGPRRRLKDNINMDLREYVLRMRGGWNWFRVVVTIN
jgi:hypothetical protein